MSLLFKPTAKCPRFPTHMSEPWPPKPVPQLSNDEVDQALTFMLAHGCAEMLLPLTQYGRRCAVKAHLDYEAITPVFGDGPRLTPQNPTQPR
jgi:hypothetical protein